MLDPDLNISVADALQDVGTVSEEHKVDPTYISAYYLNKLLGNILSGSYRMRCAKTYNNYSELPTVSIAKQGEMAYVKNNDYKNKLYLFNGTAWIDLSKVNGNDIENNAVSLNKLSLELQNLIANKQNISNLVTSFQETPDNTHYPSEKLVKDILDTKQNILVGTVIAFAGTGNIPDGWLVCDGSAISKTTYSKLFNVIGYTYTPPDYIAWIDANNQSNIFYTPRSAGYRPTAGTNVYNYYLQLAGQVTFAASGNIQFNGYPNDLMQAPMHNRFSNPPDYFNVPFLGDRFIRGGWNSFRNGAVYYSGLPNITGSFGRVQGNKDISASGAISLSSNTQDGWSGGDNDQNKTQVNFDASSSSSIYGNSTEVMPPSIEMRYIIKY